MNTNEHKMSIKMSTKWAQNEPKKSQNEPVILALFFYFKFAISYHTKIINLFKYNSLDIRLLGSFLIYKRNSGNQYLIRKKV